MLISLCQVNSKNLHHRHLHKVYQGDGGRGGKFGILYIWHVHCLQCKQNNNISNGSYTSYWMKSSTTIHLHTILYLQYCMIKKDEKNFQNRNLYQKYFWWISLFSYLHTRIKQGFPRNKNQLVQTQEGQHSSGLLPCAPQPNHFLQISTQWTHLQVRSLKRYFLLKTFSGELLKLMWNFTEYAFPWHKYTGLLLSLFLNMFRLQSTIPIEQTLMDINIDSSKHISETFII